MSNTDEILSDQFSKIIAFNRSYVDLGIGVTGALLLSKLMEWSFNESDNDCWVSKTRQQITDDTGLTRHEQDTARKKLKELSILEEVRKGVPAKLYYRVNATNLTKELNRRGING